jgi:hypothetical protein
MFDIRWRSCRHNDSPVPGYVFLRQRYVRLTALIFRDTQWGLMPLHAIHSTVKPAYFVYGKGLGYGFRDNATAFPR